LDEIFSRLVTFAHDNVWDVVNLTRSTH
jgi:hypothetical protein